MLHCTDTSQSAPPLPPDVAYRPELDGLRAVAILLVVGFHAFPDVMPGGFIGVDVFFVISGYLITRLLSRSYATNLQLLTSFYAGRARRLFPSLIVVILATLAAGWWILFPDEYAKLGDFIVSSVLFIPNLALMRGSGYFAADSSKNPLLHLWSLGIEEQFYLCWPCVLLLTRKRPWQTKRACWALLSLSLLYAVTCAAAYPLVNFYSPATRSWELLVGAILALYAGEPRSTATANGAALSGFIILVATSLTISGSTSTYSALWGVLATISAALFIFPSNKAWINKAILSRPLVVAVGRISYPLYLWHWALFSYATILVGGTPSVFARCSLVAASFLLSWATYRLIEAPIRFGSHRQRIVPWLVALMMMCGASGLLVSRLGGFPARRAERERALLEFFENSSPRFQYLYRADIFRKWRTECAFFNFAPDLSGHPVQNRKDSTPNAAIAEDCYKRDAHYEHAVLLWGDSHAKALSPGLQRHLPNTWQLLQVTTVECPPEIGHDAPSLTSQCDQSNYFAIKTVRESRPDVVVVAQNEDHSAEQLLQIATLLKTLGVKRVILVGPVPHWGSELPRILARSRLLIPRKTRELLVEKHIELNASLQRALPNTSTQKYANLMELLCDNEGCLTYRGDDVKTSITTWDYGHLTPETSEFVADKLLVKLITSAE